MGEIIDFEERTGSIKNLAITRRLAEEFIGPVSNKIHSSNIYPDISPLECMAIDIVNEIFPSADIPDLDIGPVGSTIIIRNTMRQKPIEDSAPAEYNYQAPMEDPA